MIKDFKQEGGTCGLAAVGFALAKSIYFLLEV